MSSWYFGITILLLTKINVLLASTHTCNSGSTCLDVTIDCTPNEDCFVTCQGGSRCLRTVINCPTDYQCSLNCISGAGTCWDTDIKGELSSQLNIDCTGLDVCADIIIRCPPRVQGVKKCIITANNGLYAHDGVELQFYAINGWNDIDMTYTGTYWQSGTIGTMYCTQGYGEQCSISSSAWTCTDSGHICVNPPITTTYIPTTSYPTTNAPVTVQPTTLEPTDNPTQYPSDQPTTKTPSNIPTTAQPTGNPTTSPSDQPTRVPSDIPTTSNPTSNPVTETPTTFNPTSNPVTVAPITETPTTFSPISMSSVTSTKSTIYNSNGEDGGSNEVTESTEGIDIGGGEEKGKDEQNESTNYWYILFIGITVILFIIIFIIIFLWKRKQKQKQFIISGNKKHPDIDNIQNTMMNTTGGGTNSAYNNVLDSSPMSMVLSSPSLNTKGGNTDITELQLTSISMNISNNNEDDISDEDVDGMYSTVITDNGENNHNIQTKEGDNIQTKKGEYYQNDINDDDDLYHKPTSAQTVGNTAGYTIK